jgi:hypothetical protein
MSAPTKDTGLPKGPTYPPGVGPMGIDFASLADLPQELRGRAITALQDLQDAIALNDPNASTKATTELAAIIGELQRAKADAMTTKIFADVPRVHGTHAVAKFFAERAGVKSA